jgi:hypothetical protein
MKATTFTLSPNEEEPIATKVLTAFENGNEIVTYAKSTRSQIMHQLRAEHCNDAECTKYSQTIRTMLNQFDEAAYFPVPPIA